MIQILDFSGTVENHVVPTAHAENRMLIDLSGFDLEKQFEEAMTFLVKESRLEFGLRENRIVLINGIQREHQLRRIAGIVGVKSIFFVKSDNLSRAISGMIPTTIEAFFRDFQRVESSFY